MALLDNANERGDFNSTGRGARASQGVDYFSNVVPGLQSIQSDLPADAGFREAPEEWIPGGGGGYKPQEFRDLKKDPLSDTEQGFAEALGGLAPFPIGLAIQARLGQEYAAGTVPNAPTSFVGQIAEKNAMGQNLADATTNTLRSRLDGITNFFGFNRGEAPPGGWAPGDGPRDAVTTEVGQPIAPSTIQTTELGPLGGAPGSGGGGGGYSPPGGWGNPGNGNAGDAMGSMSSMAADGGLATGTGFESPVGLSIPGYADGGPMMPNGPLLAMGFAGGGQVAGMGNPGGDVSPDMINMRVNQMLRNPRFVQSITQTLQPLMQSGELTPQEVQVMGQIAEASLQNPKLYPQLRQFVAQQGMTPLPPSFDPTVITKILAISRALAQAGGGMSQPGQATPPGQIPPTDQAQMQNPTGMANGGLLQGPGTGRSDSIGTVNESTGQPVKVATGEYVIPEHVVRAKGRDFFDALLRRYASVPKAGE